MHIFYRAKADIAPLMTLTQILCSAARMRRRSLPNIFVPRRLHDDVAEYSAYPQI